MTAYYEYAHCPGYGDDHMADEIITRAAGYLHLDGAGDHLLACVGFASHPVPRGTSTVTLPAAPGVRRKMEAALRKAYACMRENNWAHDTAISVVCRRDRRVPAGTTVADSVYTRPVILHEVRRGKRWVVESTTELICPECGFQRDRCDC